MRIRIGSLLVLVVGLLVACSAPTLPELASNAPKTTSAPAAVSAGTALALPTAYILQQPIANQVVPLTPTRSLSASPTRSTATSAPTASPLEAALSTSTLDAIVAPTPIAATAMLGDDPAMLEALLVATINQVRTTNGLPPYQHSPELSAAARAHSCDLASHGLISHESSEGLTLTQRLAGATPPWEWPSENIAAGVVDPAATVALWMDEPPEGWHRRNILDVDQREVGAGYCYVADDTTGNHHYWTADFSRRSTT
ncbi:MAG: CAP domain-containing protein [Roseiflexaceae bacterium]